MVLKKSALPSICTFEFDHFPVAAADVLLSDDKSAALVEMAKQTVPKLYLGNELALNFGQAVMQRIDEHVAFHVMEDFRLVALGLEAGIWAERQTDEVSFGAVVSIEKSCRKELQQFSFLVGIVGGIFLFFAKLFGVGEDVLYALILVLPGLAAERLSI